MSWIMVLKNKDPDGDVGIDGSLTLPMFIINRLLVNASIKTFTLMLICIKVYCII